MILEPIALASSLVASVLRLGAGRPGEERTLDSPLVLYEFEGCPFCRIAREAISVAGVPTIVRPCPKGNGRYRLELTEIGGKAQFPYLIP